jgi:phosphohistidine swiveling domain-containing protein
LLGTKTTIIHELFEDLVVVKKYKTRLWKGGRQMPYDRPLYDFNEETDIKNYKAWVLGTMWYPPPWCPLFVDLWYTYGKYGMQYGPEMLSDPNTKGWDWRFYKGGFYVTIIEPKDEEKKIREQAWREKMRVILEDPWAVWQKHKTEFQEHYNQVWGLDLSTLSDIELCDHFMEACHYTKRIAEIHFYCMYALGQGNIQFRKVLQQQHNIKPEDVEYSQLNSGFDNELTKVAQRIAELSSLAIDLGLEEIFNSSKPEELLDKVKASPEGSQWVEKFDEVIRDYGWMRRRFLEINTPTWLEDKTLLLSEVQRYISQAKTSAGTVEIRPQLEKQRKKLEDDLLNKTPKEEQEVFRRLMECSQASHVFSEDHTMYVEGIGLSLVRLAAMELGRRFVNRDMIDNPEDVLFLNHDEIFHTGIIQERSDLRTLVDKRKQEYSDYRKLEGTLPMFLGDPTKIPELVGADVIFSVAVAPPIATPEEVGASLVGCAGAPGVVEGTACVLMGDKEMDKIEPGAILVAPGTTPGWTPIFNLVSGVITDGGGYLSHALIVAREFGIPGVVGTQEATKKIKTGMRVRVDGNQCTVHILD